MINVATYGKTILVWKNLTKDQAKELQSTLVNIVNIYQSLHTNIAIPISLKQKHHYLVVLNKV